MPKGVEHRRELLEVSRDVTPRNSVMPKGVEHPLTPFWMKVVFGPRNSVMPKGVEHLLRLAGRVRNDHRETP